MSIDKLLAIFTFRDHIGFKNIIVAKSCIASQLKEIDPALQGLRYK